MATLEKFENKHRQFSSSFNLDTCTNIIGRLKNVRTNLIVNTSTGLRLFHWWNRGSLLKMNPWQTNSYCKDSTLRKGDGWTLTFTESIATLSFLEQGLTLSPHKTCHSNKNEHTSLHKVLCNEQNNAPIFVKVSELILNSFLVFKCVPVEFWFLLISKKIKDAST